MQSWAILIGVPSKDLGHGTDIGLSRTGTLTLKVALQRLGLGPCYHAFEYLGIPEHTALWHEAVDRAGDFDWERIFHGYRSIIDLPAVYFWRELVDAYPDALVVLTERDPDRWYDSFVATLQTAQSQQLDPTDTAVPPRQATARRCERAVLVSRDERLRRGRQ